MWSKQMVLALRRGGLFGVMIAYVGACLVFGGASRDLLEVHAMLQAIAALGIALLIITWPRGLALEGVKTPVVLLFALVLLGFIQILPLPVSVWTSLPGRDFVLDGFDILGVDPVALPISLDKEASLRSLGYALTPLFVILLSVRIDRRSLKRFIPAFLCAVGVISVAIGLSQVYGGEGQGLYPYQNTNVGFPVGAFANVNHFASLLLMIFPFAILLTRDTRIRRADFGGRIALMAMLSATLLFLCTGVVAAGSLAVYLMLFPVLSLAYLGSRDGLPRETKNPFTGLLVFSAIAFGLGVVLSSPVLEGLGVTGSAEDPTSRQNMWSYTINAIDAYWPAGTGVGTYESVIPQFEDPDAVATRYIALAHNEYLQIILEYGVVGAGLLVAGTLWLLNLVKRTVFGKLEASERAFQRMALIGICVCACHSIVDYPVRTPAIASVLALYVVIASRIKETKEHSKTQDPQDPRRLVL